MIDSFTKKQKPRADLKDEEIKELFVVAIRQHRDDCRRWASLRIGLVNHLGHDYFQELETWVATFYSTKKRVPLDSDVEEFADQLLEKSRSSNDKTKRKPLR
jgi:hypothetical protein